MCQTEVLYLEFLMYVYDCKLKIKYNVAVKLKQNSVRILSYV